MGMSNEQMQANRFLRWHDARQKVAAIREHLLTGGVVQVVTMTKAWQYERKHVDWFEARKNGAFVRQGRQSVCIDGAGVRFGRYKAA